MDLTHVTALPSGTALVLEAEPGYDFMDRFPTAKRERIAALLDWRAPALVSPAPLPPPQCPGCGQVMKLIGSVARKPP